MDTAVAIFVSGLLAFTAAAKLRDLSAFETAVKGYETFPASGVPFVARLVPSVEITVALGCALPPTRTPGLIAAGGVFVGFAFLTASALWRGVSTQCGCAVSGPAEGDLTWYMPARNVVFALVSWAPVVSTTERSGPWLLIGLLVLTSYLSLEAFLPVYRHSRPIMGHFRDQHSDGNPWKSEASKPRLGGQS